MGIELKSKLEKLVKIGVVLVIATIFLSLLNYFLAVKKFAEGFFPVRLE